MDAFPIRLFLFAGAVLVPRLFTVLCHELGHAIPAILMTRQTASIYIGSYGDQTKSLHLSIGLLDIWLKYNPFLWRFGLCVPSAKEISINRQIIYTLAGPLASLLVALFACYFTFAVDLHGYLKVIVVVSLGSSILDLYRSLSPTSTPVKLFDGTSTYNDGHSLKQLFYYKRFAPEYEKAVELYNQQNFFEAANSFSALLRSGLRDEDIYGVAIVSLIRIKNYKRAKELSDEFILKGNLDSDDFSNAGFIHSQLDQLEKALEYYQKSLELNPGNKYSLNNKGFTLNLLNRFEEAITSFDKAIEIDKDYAYSYNNRGLAKIKIGQTEEGLEDINHSFRLDANDSYGYRNLGIYHLDKGEYSKALELFVKAKELDGTTHLIDELITKASAN